MNRSFKITYSLVYCCSLKLLALVVINTLLIACKRELSYGTNSNEIRKKLFVPVIESNMVDKKEYRYAQGNRWTSKVEFPEKTGEVLHIWKIVTPLTDTGGLYKEADAFRKRVSNSLVFQLNVYSEILGDSISMRSGKIFRLGDKVSKQEQDLNEKQLDSVFFKWGLSSLIRQ